MTKPDMLNSCYPVVGDVAKLDILNISYPVVGDVAKLDMLNISYPVVGDVAKLDKLVCFSGLIRYHSQTCNHFYYLYVWTIIYVCRFTHGQSFLLLFLHHLITGFMTSLTHIVFCSFTAHMN